MNVLFSLSFIGFKVASTAKVILRTFLFQLLWVEEDPGYTWVEQLTFSLEDNGYECLICTRLTILMWKSSSILFPPTLGFIIVYIQIKYHWILRKRGWAKIYHWTKWTSTWLDKNMRSIFLSMTTCTYCWKAILTLMCWLFTNKQIEPYFSCLLPSVIFSN